MAVPRETVPFFSISLPDLRSPQQAAEKIAVDLKQFKRSLATNPPGDAGKMASLGGKLDGVGAKHDAAWLKEYIANPKSKKPDSKMAKVTLTDQQLSDVVAYLATLK